MQSRSRHVGRFFELPAVFAFIMVLWLGATATAVSDPAATSSEGPGLPSVTVSSTYRLSPYDVIDVSVYNEEDLHTRARLGSDGAVLLPLIGNISLGGMTVSEANDAIKKRYGAGFVKDPHVLVIVLEYRKSTFSILGQVERPGIYEIPEGTHVSIVDAVLMAGGFTRLAAQNSVRVKRMVKGHATVFKVHAGDMADRSDVVPFDVQAGDVIKVNESWF